MTAFGFVVAQRGEGSRISIVASGLVMGLGIAAMHYTGMAAMRSPFDLRHEHLWVAISTLIAIGAAIAALWLASQRTRPLQRLAAALVMGVAVAGMRYAAMQGAVFTPSAPIDRAHGQASVGQTYLALWVTGTTILILILALVAAMFDRHFAFRAHQEATRLRESEQRFRLLLQALTDYAIFMLHADGRVANWNAGAQRIKGYDASEVVGTSFRRFYTPEDVAAGRPEEALETAARDGRFVAEGWRLRKDGSRFWASVVLQVIRGDGGELIGFAKVTRDITDRKTAEEELDRARTSLAQSQKMEAVGQLTGGVAHDFNNLLMAITASLELLGKRIPDDPRSRRLIETAAQAAQRGAAMTQRMLAFAPRQTLLPSAVDLPDLVGGMMDLLRRTIGPGVRIETRFPRGLPHALVDANQLELALLNLVVNARDAMPGGGTIVISSRVEDGPEQSSNRFVSLSVSDTGEGMDAETLARAQEPFFTTKGIGKGTGLGLSMVQGLAEQSRGRLRLESEKGKGTTAEIWLPATDRPPSEALAPSSLPVRNTAAQGLRILLVDDDPLVLENTTAMLEEIGHAVTPANSGQKALDTIARDDAGLDLLITDQAMPGMTGAELARAVKGLRPSLPIVLATGYADLPNDMLALFHKLDKPFDLAALSEAIETATSGAAPERGRTTADDAREGVPAA